MLDDEAHSLLDVFLLGELAESQVLLWNYSECPLKAVGSPIMFS